MSATRQEIREYVAAKLGRMHLVTITEDVGDATIMDCTGISDLTEDDERLQDSFVIVRDGSATPEWRRITAVNTSLEQFTVNRAFGTPPASQSAAILGLLDPDEWNAAINEALTELYFPERAELPLTTFLDSNGNTLVTTEYDLPDWVQTRGQLKGLYYRDLTFGKESAVPRYKVFESSAGVRIVLVDAPSSTWATTYTLVIDATRWHPSLLDDTFSTNCPQQLWQAAVEVAALHKVLKKYGLRYKAQFAQDLAIAERKLMQMRAAILPVVQPREFNTDDDWEGPDIDPFFNYSSWW